MLSEICFQQIKDNFWYAAYGEFRVVMDRSNGFVNATKLCSSGGKHFYQWTRNDTNRRLMETLQNWSYEGLENTHESENILQGTPCKFTGGYANTLKLIAGQMKTV